MQRRQGYELERKTSLSYLFLPFSSSRPPFPSVQFLSFLPPPPVRKRLAYRWVIDDHDIAHGRGELNKGYWPILSSEQTPLGTFPFRGRHFEVTGTAANGHASPTNVERDMNFATVSQAE